MLLFMDRQWFRRKRLHPEPIRPGKEKMKIDFKSRGYM